MLVTLRFTLEAEKTQAFRDIVEAARKFGLALERVQSKPNAARPRPWYAAVVTDQQGAERFLAAAKDSPVVDAAFLKPTDEVP